MMRRSQHILLLCLAVALAQPAAAQQGGPIAGWFNYRTQSFSPALQPPPRAVTKPIIAGGTLTIRASASSKGIPATAAIRAVAKAGLSDGTYSDGVGAAPVTATRTDETATISVTLTYIFTALHAGEPMTVSVEFTSQEAPFPFANITKTIPLPPDGAKTVVTLPAAL